MAPSLFIFWLKFASPPVYSALPFYLKLESICFLFYYVNFALFKASIMLSKYYISRKIYHDLRKISMTL